MPNDNMHQFIALLVRWCLMAAVILALLLLLLAAALLWYPKILVEILRFGLATACVIGAAYILFSLFGMLLHRKASSK